MEKEFAKKYLITLSALFFGGTAVLFALMLAFKGFESELTPTAMLGIAALCALVPSGSFAGFVLLGSRIKEIGTKRAVLLIVFFPLILVLVTLYGIVMLIPSAVKTVRNLVRK